LIPNLSIQNLFVEKIEEIENETQKLETVYQKKLDNLEQLRKSILQKAFAGELKTEKVTA
jgi:type I restriction enzyme S subunit